ncbi:hypothetical protein BI364_03710 [Acidihalobacter yilgarnensis]|uniref:Transglycosylase SLT domain-containing protein n=2 Tax=Acidihalobacter yilgarnensis TaxID=2819280 RepID=A0A1D8ISS2_9GAMM|nr:hypothetical protein BI364_03710 [Acidihalobacter yilgarnensis]
MAAVVATAALNLTHTARADGYIYIYKQPNGAYLFTDKNVNKHNYTLLKRMGRPTATASCLGITRSILKKRARAYALTVERIAASNRLDPLLMRAIITVESCYDAHATSSVGARGLMQLMPTTGAHMGIHDLYDPINNLEAGMRYFKSLMRRFSNNVRLSLAAYNAGPTAVLKYDGVPPYPETQNYVSRVLAHYRKLVNGG